MFSTITITAFLIVIAVLCAHYLILGRSKTPPTEKTSLPVSIIRKAVLALALLLIEKDADFAGRIRKLLYLLTILVVITLTITGFVPRLLLGHSMTGYWMMIHTTAAGIFCVTIAILLVMWANKCRFERKDSPWLAQLFKPATAEQLEQIQEQKSEIAHKIAFWLIAVLSLVVILSAVLTMLPLFGTEIQRTLLTTHRYTTLATVLTMVVHTYLVGLQRARQMIAH